MSADHAGLAFSPDGDRIAFSAGEEAKCWEIGSGRLVGAWRLPPGLHDTLAFPDADHLFLAREETTTGTPPLGEFSVEEHPRVGRVRRLKPENKTELVREFREHSAGHFQVGTLMDGRFFVFGIREVNGVLDRSIMVFGVQTGDCPWRRPTTARSLVFDPSGKDLAILGTDEPRRPSIVLKAPSMAERHTVDLPIKEFAPLGRLWALNYEPSIPGTRKDQVVIVQGHPGRVLFGLDLDPSYERGIHFSPDDRFAVWGQADGTVAVLEVEAVRDQLANVGLDW